LKGGHRSKRIVKGRDNRNGWRDLCSRSSEQRSAPVQRPEQNMNPEHTMRKL